MSSAAILIGNAHYDHEDDLDCCLADLEAVRILIQAIGRHQVVRCVGDANADAMRDAVRSVLGQVERPEEVFFYFTGHGAQIGAEFYFCGTNFQASRPNETGLSHGELYEMVRAAEPGLFVNVIDACSSGTPLIKSSTQRIPVRKDGFRHVLQLASCLDDQASWGGDPLSEFTEAFCQACLRRTEGVVYYSDVANSLRDDFLNRDDQIPFFVSQGTGREVLVEDASRLGLFRDHVRELLTDDKADGEGDDAGAVIEVGDIEPSLLDLLSRAERKIATPQKAERFIASLFDAIKREVSEGEIGELFDLDVREHRSFEEPSTRDFIARILARQERSDNLVTARVRNMRLDELGREHALSGPSALALAAISGWQGVTERVDLEINCTLPIVQIGFTLTPRYQSLQRLVLVITCAPSLEICYVFEMLTRHQRTDWERYAPEGAEVVKRWYKMDWEDDATGLAGGIYEALEKSVRDHIEQTAGRIDS